MNSTYFFNVPAKILFGLLAIVNCTSSKESRIEKAGGKGGNEII